MVWFKVDDTLHSHPKARRAGLPAMGLWSIAGSYASQYVTEGFVPEWFVSSWQGWRKNAQALVDAGLWEVGEHEGERGWWFHDWSHYQPTKAEVERDQAANRERQRRFREKRREAKANALANGSSNGVSNGVTNGGGNGTPTRPDPTIEEANASSSDASRLDVERACQHLADRIEANGSKRPTVGKKWRDAARLMLDNDGRTERQIHNMIDWCQSDEFWRSNVLSMPTLREKYDQMRLKAIGTEKPRGPSRSEIERAATDPLWAARQ